jgi:hypothetical protein
MMLYVSLAYTRSFEDMMAIMRYNNFQHDPLSSQLPDCQSVPGLPHAKHSSTQVPRMDQLHSLVLR